jgi:hypothetical protein
MSKDSKGERKQEKQRQEVPCGAQRSPAPDKPNRADQQQKKQRERVPSGVNSAKNSPELCRFEDKHATDRCILVVTVSCNSQRATRGDGYRVSRMICTRAIAIESSVGKRI